MDSIPEILFIRQNISWILFFYCFIYTECLQIVQLLRFILTVFGDVQWITVSNLLFKQSHQSKMQIAGPVIWVNKKIKVAPRILLLNSCISWPYCLINLCSYCMPWFCLSIIHFWLVDVCIIIIICIYGCKNY